MVELVILLLIYGPIAVTLGCCLFFAVQAGLTRQAAVVRVLVEKSTRPWREAPSEPMMRTLLGVLILLTALCGLAAGVTISLAPAYADARGDGYEHFWQDSH